MNASEAKLTVTPTGTYGALSAVNWMQGRKYLVYGSPDLRNPYEQLVAPEAKWAGLGLADDGTWIVVFVS